MKLERMTLEKLDEYYAAISETTEECYKYVGGQKQFTHEQIKNYMARIISDESRVDYFIMVNNTIIGEIVLNEMSAHKSANIRLAIYDDRHFGKGYGTEAMKEVIRAGFKNHGLHRIELEVYDFNARGRALYKKMGFKEEGILRDAYKTDQYHDIIVMSILEDEFKG